MRLPDKQSLPGRKQVFRQYKDGRFSRDVLARYDEVIDGEPLLVPVLQRGKSCMEGQGGLVAIRDHAGQQIETLPSHLRAIHRTDPLYAVKITPRLKADQTSLQSQRS